MEWKRILRRLNYPVIGWLAVFSLTAAEHHGLVKFSGLPVPGATVTATQGDKKVVAVTDQQGAYTFPDLADGTWTIQVEMLCFSSQKEDVGVAPNAPAPTWELKLLPLADIKAVAQTPAAPAAQGAPATAGAGPAATANGAAPPPNPSLQQALDKANAASASKAGAKTKAGKKGATAQATAPQAGFQRAQVNASSDGAAAPPPSEATIPSAADASQAGGASDAMVVNGSVSNGIERRAIGNARKGFGSLYRGDAFGNIENSALDARAFSITGQNTPQPAFNHLRFGVSFGGPFYIPHVLRSNGQFFINYQGGRNRNANVAAGLMPTLLERSGDLSQLLNAQGQAGTVYDPSSGAPFPGNLIPQNRISPQARALLGYYPLPTFDASSQYNYQIPLVGTGDSDAVQSRVTRILNRNNFVNGGFAYQSSRGTNPNLFGFKDDTGSSGLSANATWRRMFSQRLNVALTYTFSRQATRGTPYFAKIGKDVSGDAGITGNDRDPLNWGPPNLSFPSGGIFGLSDGLPSFTRNQTQSLTANVLWVHRPHNITIGADYRRQEFNQLQQQDPRGDFSFTGAATQSGGPLASPSGTGSGFADFLLGIPDTSYLAFGNADKYLRNAAYDAYFTDDWRVGPGLTVNAGMRWEYGAPIYEKYGRMVNLDIAPGFAASAPVLGLSPVGPLTGQTYPSSLVRPYKHAFQPRIALAWHPLFGSSLVVRAGYGVYYNTSVYNAIAQQMLQQSPLSKSLNVQNTPTNPLTLANGFIGSPATTANTFAINPDFHPGYAQNWQVSVQRDLAESMQVTATYLGIKGTRAVQGFLPNTYPSGVNPCPTCLAGYTYLDSNGNSTREAGQIQLRRRLHSGFTASVQYTFAKAFDNAMLGGRGQGSQVIAQNWLNLSAERGYSSFDQRHLTNVQIQYTTGMGAAGGTFLRGWKGAAFKGWTIISNITYGSGLPETPIYGVAVAGTGSVGSIRPDLTGLPIYGSAPQFLNPLAFTKPQPGQWGDAGRNSIIGPAQFSLNASAGRSFGDFDLRFDSSNSLNHVTFPSWNTNILNVTQFGRTGAANGMRNVQANLRWRF